MFQFLNFIMLVMGSERLNCECLFCIFETFCEFYNASDGIEYRVLSFVAISLYIWKFLRIEKKWKISRFVSIFKR